MSDPREAVRQAVLDALDDPYCDERSTQIADRIFDALEASGVFCVDVTVHVIPAGTTNGARAEIEELTEILLSLRRRLDARPWWRKALGLAPKDEP